MLHFLLPFKVHFQQSFAKAQQDFILVHGLEKKYKLHHHDIAQWIQNAWEKSWWLQLSILGLTLAYGNMFGLWNKTSFNK